MNDDPRDNPALCYDEESPWYETEACELLRAGIAVELAIGEFVLAVRESWLGRLFLRMVRGGRDGRGE